MTRTIQAGTTGTSVTTDFMSRPENQRDDRSAEAALVARASGGCRDSFAALVHAHQDRLFNFLLRRCGDAHQAEDMAQAAFLRAWEKLDRYDPAWRFSTWLYTIASRLAIDHEQNNRRVNGLRERATAYDHGDSRCDPVDVIARRDDAAAVWLLADWVLSADDRTALWLRYGTDASLDQIAAVLGRTNSAVRVLLHRARRRLAEAWQERSGEYDRRGADGVAVQTSPTPCPSQQTRHEGVRS